MKMKISSVLSFLLLALALAACTTAAPPDGAPLSVERVDADVTTASGAAFLPPVGTSVDTAGFFPGADLRFELYALENGVPGRHLLPDLSTADGSIRVTDDHYQANWRVKSTRSDYPDVTDVRLLAWRLDAGPDADCLEPRADGEPCLVGSFDVTIRKAKGKAGAGAKGVVTSQTLPVKLWLGGQTAPDSLDDLRPLSDPTTPFSLDGGNCPVDEFNMPGQGLRALGSGLRALGSGLRALGSVGGLFILGPDSDPTAGDGVRLFDAPEGGELAASIDGAIGPDGNAAILVVDDFGQDPNAQFGYAPIFRLDDALLTPAAGLTEAELQALVDGDGFSHGALVMHHLVQTLAGAGFDHEEPTPSDSGDLRLFTRSADAALPDDQKRYVLVAAVDTEGLDTDVIAERIRTALWLLDYYNNEFSLAIDDVAVNMSFAIVPCAVLEDFEASDLETFEDYVAALGADNAVAETFYDDLVRVLLTPLDPDTDPLRLQTETCLYEGPYYNRNAVGFPEPVEEEGGSYTPGYYGWGDVLLYPYEYFPYNEGGFVWYYCYDGNAHVNYVASSGNFGLDYPLYPAAWPLVVGVGSQDAAVPSGFEDARSDYANSGAVLAPGLLIELGRSTTGQYALGYAGTSFSAPVGSVFVALDMMRDEPRCALNASSRLDGVAEDADTPLDDAVASVCLP